MTELYLFIAVLTVVAGLTGFLISRTRYTMYACSAICSTLLVTGFAVTGIGQ